jgi:glucose-6-phosphate 1-epimerase
MSFEPIVCDGAPAFRLTTTDGASIVVLQRGAHLISWCDAAGNERLYCSPISPLVGPAAVRGGVPVIFPQFGTLGVVGRHGFARTAEWKCVGHGPHSIEMALVHTAQEHAAWPHDCECRLLFTLGTNALEMAFSVRNTGASALSFTAALHTYWALASEDSYIDGLHTDGSRWPLAGFQDEMIFDAPASLQIQTPRGVLHTQTHGFRDLVVWNPGANHGLGDLPADGYRDYACVEAAQLTPVKLESGGIWRGSQHIAF